MMLGAQIFNSIFKERLAPVRCRDAKHRKTKNPEVQFGRPGSWLDSFQNLSGHFPTNTIKNTARRPFAGFIPTINARKTDAHAQCRHLMPCIECGCQNCVHVGILKIGSLISENGMNYETAGKDCQAHLTIILYVQFRCNKSTLRRACLRLQRAGDGHSSEPAIRT